MSEPTQAPPSTSLDRQTYMRAYRERNRDVLREKKKQYYQAHKGETYQRNKRFISNNQESVARYLKDYREANREHLVEQNRKYNRRRTESGKSAEAKRNWRRNNPDKAKAKSLRDKAIRQSREQRAVGTCSAVQLRARIDFFGGVCAYCGGPYEAIDHVVPLAKGGTSWPANLRPACTKCNRSKGANIWFEVRL